MWGRDQVEAGGMDSERTHPRQNKGVRSLLVTSQESTGWETKGEILQGDSEWGLFLMGEGEVVWRSTEFSSLGNCAWL